MKGTVGIRPFIAQDAAAICALCQAEGWDYWDDSERVARALGGPGVTTLVAERGCELVGAVEVISDGEINWMIGAMIVASAVRNEGIGTRLLEAAFEASGAKRLDLQTEDDGPRFYRRFEGREMVAFRLYLSSTGNPRKGMPPTSRSEGPPSSNSSSNAAVQSRTASHRPAASAQLDRELRRIRTDSTTSEPVSESAG